MSSIDHILLPTDGSDGSLHAAAFAGELARALDARVTVLHILREEYLVSHSWGPDGFITGRPGGFSLEDASGMKPIEEVRSALEEKARGEELAKAAKALGETKGSPDLVTVWGHAGEEITRYANDNKVGMIVIGSYGKSKIKRAFLGSVSQSVANLAQCPVTIVK